MRLAVSLPSLPSTAVERHQIEAAVAALSELGQVEILTESTRLREGGFPAPAYHYLCLPERHAAAPFDAALHIVGRDFRPYEVGVLLARRLPSVVWLLDSMTHHVLVGGLAPHGRWDRYFEILDEHLDDGASVAATIAAGWGTRALFRRRDPLPARLARQNRIVAAFANVAAGLSSSPPVVGLPTDVAVLRDGPRGGGAIETVAVVAPNLSWPVPELRALAALVQARPGVTVRYHLIEWFAGAVMGPARQLGLHDAIEWVVEDGIEQRQAVADSGDAVVATTGDPTLNDRGLVQRAMAAGKVAVVTRSPAWDSLPAGTAAVVEPGREREPALAATLEALVDEAGLASSIGAAAVEALRPGTGAGDCARELMVHLNEQAAERPATLLRTAPEAIRRVRASMREHAVPHNAGAEAAALITERLDAILPGAASREV